MVVGKKRKNRGKYESCKRRVEEDRTRMLVFTEICRERKKEIEREKERHREGEIYI